VRRLPQDKLGGDLKWVLTVKQVEKLAAKICLIIHFSTSEEQNHNSGLNDS
jgi:hypothetical protein